MPAQPSYSQKKEITGLGGYRVNVEIRKHPNPGIGPQRYGAYASCPVCESSHKSEYRNTPGIALEALKKSLKAHIRRYHPEVTQPKRRKKKE
jgi:hypothetical protein